MRTCVMVFGKTDSIASEKPLSPSTQAMKMSQTPRFHHPVDSESQNFAPSLSAVHSPSVSYLPSTLTPIARQMQRLGSTADNSFSSGGRPIGGRIQQFRADSCIVTRERPKRPPSASKTFFTADRLNSS
jgi:hypothetical protein